jgi:hypothetical protein
MPVQFVPFVSHSRNDTRSVNSSLPSIRLQILSGMVFGDQRAIHVLSIHPRVADAEEGKRSQLRAAHHCQVRRRRSVGEVLDKITTLKIT